MGLDLRTDGEQLQVRPGSKRNRCCCNI